MPHLFSLCVGYCHDHLAPAHAIPWLVEAEEHQLDELGNLALAYTKRELHHIQRDAADTMPLLARRQRKAHDIMETLEPERKRELARLTGMPVTAGLPTSASEADTSSSPKPGSPMPQPAGTKRERDNE